MNLELKHLAPYLPYGLKAEMLDYEMDYVGRKYDEIIGVHQWSKNKDWCLLTDGGSKPSFDRIKPILRPLSDLVKIIKVYGKAFIPIMVVFGGENYREYNYTIDLSERPILGKRIEISVEDLGSPCVTFFLNNVLNNLLTYHNWQLLLEWHFDVFGLIEQGIAIDINTLKT